MVGLKLLESKLPVRRRGETQRLARDNEHDAVIGIVQVVRVTIVRIEPAIVIVVFDIEDIEIAVGVCIVYHASHTTAL